VVAASFYANLAFLVLAMLWFQPWYAIGPILLAAASGEKRIEMQGVLFTLSAGMFYVADGLVTRLLGLAPELRVWLLIAGGLVVLGPPVVYGVAGLVRRPARVAVGAASGGV
jgi:hypothetical protein